MNKVGLCLLALVSFVFALPVVADDVVIVTKGTQQFTRFQEEDVGWKKLKGAEKFYSVLFYSVEFNGPITFEAHKAIRIYYGKKNGLKYYSLYPSKGEDFTILDLGNGKIGVALDQTATPGDPPITIKTLATLDGNHNIGVIKSLTGTIVSHEYDNSGNLIAIEWSQSNANAIKQFAKSGGFEQTKNAVIKFLKTKGYVEVPDY